MLGEETTLYLLILIFCHYITNKCTYYNKESSENPDSDIRISSCDMSKYSEPWNSSAFTSHSKKQID